jgi:hypothetical protein
MNQHIANSFHSYADAELQYVHPKHYGGVTVTTETKHVIIHEREVSYRFYPHAHPFVQEVNIRFFPFTIAIFIISPKKPKKLRDTTEKIVYK